MLLQPEKTGLLVIDLQPSLVAARWNQETLIANVRRLIQGADALGMPMLVAEQNPGKLGTTVAPVAELLSRSTAQSKMTFSCWRNEALREAIQALNREAWLLCGVEAHVCVCQTGLDLLEAGRQVHVAADATGSRTQANWEAGLDRLRQAGAVVTTTEMALFELLGGAEHARFRVVQNLVR